VVAGEHHNTVRQGSVAARLAPHRTDRFNMDGLQRQGDL
jgi:hypothetical protein